MRIYKQDLIAALGEFVGTTLFLLLAFGGAKTAQVTRTTSQLEGLSTSLGNQTILFIAVSFGLSLLVNAWVFYRVTGGLFNPAVTLALFATGGLSVFRCVLLIVSQLCGGIAAAALVAALTPFGGAESLKTTLGTGVNVTQGLFIEAFLTAILCLTVLLLAAEKHKSTYLAPIGIGLALFSCHLFGVVWTGCGMNPARALGPSVVASSFPHYHWIYWLGPFIGSLMAVGFYLLLKVSRSVPLTAAGASLWHNHVFRRCKHWRGPSNSSGT
ncbi:aquaporin-like protein [Acaromyces ingoldii]|uniref:Aquaporin-like protein n=1 Tax=Acaromyces ingoldii TaxID=215250 RepID=A0A316YE89_9BASI|nr:aquaporin-like protein [Acaromyces ingoldii]PWN86948.1 aquaporin-like protein [Acaromyces ingoldii]